MEIWNYVFRREIKGISLFICQISYNAYYERITSERMDNKFIIINV